MFALTFGRTHESGLPVAKSLDSFNCRSTLKVGDTEYVYYSLVEAEKNVGGRRIGEEAVLVGFEHVAPVPVAPGQLGRFMGFQRLVAHGIEAEAGRQHQALLRAADSDIHAPFVLSVIEGPQ